MYELKAKEYLQAAAPHDWSPLQWTMDLLRLAIATDSGGCARPGLSPIFESANTKANSSGHHPREMKKESDSRGCRRHPRFTRGAAPEAVTEVTPQDWPPTGIYLMTDTHERYGEHLATDARERRGRTGRLSTTFSCEVSLKPKGRLIEHMPSKLL
jgi:hypothetical protein